jgi:hypothetical protein
MNRKERLNELMELADPKALRLEPKETYDNAIIGLTSDGRIVYSEAKILMALQEVDGMEYEEALEWYEYNTSRGVAYAGKKAPIIVTTEP